MQAQSLISTVLRRSFDLVISFAAILIFAPVMLLTALSIWFEDRGSIFFVQNRIGRGLRPFKVFKFRTMVEDKTRATGDFDTTASSSISDARQKFQTTSANDSRITSVGKLIRPVHLDELPQLFNVFRGDMSLVGVRPDVAVQEADYTPEQWRERHKLRPGITGVAQIDPNVTSMDDRTERDLFWVRNSSLSLYFKVLWQTFAKVLKRNSV